MPWGYPRKTFAEVAELVDALASGASGGNPVEVQVLSSAPFLVRFWQSKVVIGIATFAEVLTSR